jgi:phosphoribosylanthranilate isomerase
MAGEGASCCAGGRRVVMQMRGGLSVLVRPDVKICGVCDPRDAEEAVAAGATHIGVIRVPGSRRTRPLGVARSICEAVVGALRVGVYVDASMATILREAEVLGLDVVQLHGQENEAWVAGLASRGMEVWKVVKPERAEDLLAAADRYRDVDLLLVEGRSDLGRWGMGTRFRWGEVAAAADRLPLGTLLGVAGGLTPENVGQAVRRFQPALVDVSSGVESEVGRKDPRLVREFIRNARGPGRGPTLD